MIEFLPLDTFFLLFEYFYIPIWGLFAALSIVFFVFLYIRNIEKYNISKEHAIHSMIHFAFWSLIGVLVAHRVLFLSNYSILNIGGRDSAGIFIGLIALLIYLIYNKVDFKNFFDMMIIPMIGLGAVMRIGCFLVACETGRQSAVPWSMFYQEAFRHNMGLYYLIINFAILAFLFYLEKKSLKKGNLFIAGFFLYSMTRFMVDFLRACPPQIYFGLSLQQILYLLLSIIAIMLWIKNNNSIKYFKNKKKRKNKGKLKE